MRSLAELAKEYGVIKAQITAVNKRLAELQRRKEESRDLVMAELAAQGVKSATLPEIGKITIRETGYYRIVDDEAFALACLRSLVAAGQEGRPLSDGLLAQKRVAAEVFDAYVSDAGYSDDDLIRMCGVQRAVREDLAFTASRK